ncbi:DUF1543 domain-containing protein [Pedobacter changchengzhani]|uniref:DUF1543 domain-containing protein n=1 Tax=Pedobacter changchengzhani TaxID=2529274 RepID=A0A4R5MMK1_9SPHI|nr:DUF1543 domain-containing protein [Pedobacter changchengzhani]TDG36971.1 DUF1543 domain-containing protein [Pedobacter changchengzhani]
MINKEIIAKKPKLYMLLLGSKAPNRNVEQHDYFFGIANSLKELIPEIKAFWPEAGKSIHVDGWREVKKVDGFEVTVVDKTEDLPQTDNKLYFINLGGYQADKLEEQHYIVLTVKAERALAIHHAKKTIFFKKNFIAGANSHIDEKYGVDVDDIYKIDDILSQETKEKYQIKITPNANLREDEIHLGYFKLDKL